MPTRIKFPDNADIVSPDDLSVTQAQAALQALGHTINGTGTKVGDVITFARGVGGEKAR